MEPVPIHSKHREAYPDLQPLQIVAPPGVPEDECGTVEALVGHVDGGPFDGGPLFREFWSLTPEEIEVLKNGGQIQLFFYSNGMPPHGMIVMENPDA